MSPIAAATKPMRREKIPLLVERVVTIAGLPGRPCFPGSRRGGFHADPHGVDCRHPRTEVLAVPSTSGAGIGRCGEVWWEGVGFGWCGAAPESCDMRGIEDLRTRAEAVDGATGSRLRNDATIRREIGTRRAVLPRLWRSMLGPPP